MSFDMGDRAYHLAVSGDVFRWMVDYGSHETLQRVSGSLRRQVYHWLILYCYSVVGALRYICAYVAGREA